MVGPCESSHTRILSLHSPVRLCTQNPAERRKIGIIAFLDESHRLPDRPRTQDSGKSTGSSENSLNDEYDITVRSMSRLFS